MTFLMILNKSYGCLISHTGDRDHLKERKCRKREGEGRKGEGEGERGREKGSPLYPAPNINAGLPKKQVYRSHVRTTIIHHEREVVKC